MENASNHIWRMIEWVLQCANLNRESKHSYILPAVHFNILLPYLLYQFRLIFGALMRMHCRNLGKVQCHGEIECLTMVSTQSQVSTKTSDLIFLYETLVYNCWTIDGMEQIEISEIQGYDWLRRKLKGSHSQSINHKQLLNLLYLNFSNAKTEEYLEWR